MVIEGVAIMLQQSEHHDKFKIHPFGGTAPQLQPPQAAS
jgi:hypothetical protein